MEEPNEEPNKVKPRHNWLKLLGGLVGLLLIMWIPALRNIVIFILPLGSGIDDLIVIIALFLIVTVLMIKASATEFAKFKQWFYR